MAESSERETRSRAAVRDADVPASTSSPDADKDNGGAQVKVEDQVKAEAEVEEPVLKKGLEEVNDGSDAIKTDDQSAKGQEQSAAEHTAAKSSLKPAIGDNTAGTAVAIDASIIDSSNPAQGPSQEQISTQIQPQAQDDAPVANVNNAGTTEASMAATDAVYDEDGSNLSDAPTSLDSEFETGVDAENGPEDVEENTGSAQNQGGDEAIDELPTEIAETQSQGKNEIQPADNSERESESLPSAPAERESTSLKRALEDDDKKDTQDASTSTSSSQPNAGKKQRTDQKVLSKSKAHTVQSKLNETKQARTANGNDETLSLLQDTINRVSEGLIDCPRTIEQVQKVLAELQASIDKTKSSLKEVTAGIR
ncbi:hypothetical protein BDW69DRAFT_81395 [Aspergillus filifer]